MAAGGEGLGALRPWVPWVEQRGFGHARERRALWVFTDAAPAPAGVGGYDGQVSDLNYLNYLSRPGIKYLQFFA